MFAGRYYNGRDAQFIAVACEVVGGTHLSIRGEGVASQFALTQIRVSPRLARTYRTLSLADGAQVQTDDNDAVDAAFPQRNRLESFVDRLERHWRAVVASIAISLVSVVLFFAFGLPWLADRAAQKIPQSLQQAMGEQALDLMRRIALDPSALPEEKRAALQTRFSDFVRDIPGANYRLEFFASPRIGPNAFALPGGTIVFTDEMIGMLDNDDQFLAVAAHEIGHEQHRHLLRGVLQNSAVIVLGALFTGDVGSASTVVIGIPTFLMQSHYTRGFEQDADDYALATLAEHGISPQAFADVMRKFEEKHPDIKGGMLAYASSHPPTEDRIERAETAARAYDARHPK